MIEFSSSPAASCGMLPQMSLLVSSESCPHCGGSGWKTIPATSTKPQSVIRCECRVGNWSHRLLKKAHIPARYEHCTISDFNLSGDVHTSLAEAKVQAQGFVKEYPIQTGLLLVGPIGVGKTHLAVGIIRQLMAEKGAECLFYDYRELLKDIQNSYNASVQTTELEVLRPVVDCEVLLLDELGAVKPTEWVADTVSYLLNARYNERRTTIITTNFKCAPASDDLDDPNNQLAQARRAVRKQTLGDRIGDRMLSRLREMCKLVEMQGEDFRQKLRPVSQLTRRRL
jgi:DNA replication protein DnaC